MSEIDRAELRRLLAAATPRPWWQDWVEGDEWFAVYGQPTGGLVCPEACTAGDADDTNLLVAAVNALPDLLGALEKAETHRDSLAATLAREDRAAEAIERVRELHAPYYPLRGGHPGCAACEGDEFVHYPCPTIQALEGVMGDE